MHHLGGGRWPIAALLAATDGLLEALAELVRHVVVDDRVGTRVAVGHAVPQQTDHLVHLTGRQRTEVGHECVNVVRQP